MATEWVDRLVFKIDVSWSAESFLQCIGTYKRSRPIVLILFKHRFWNVNPRVCNIKLLLGAFRRKDMAEIIGIGVAVGVAVVIMGLIALGNVTAIKRKVASLWIQD